MLEANHCTNLTVTADDRLSLVASGLWTGLQPPSRVKPAFRVHCCHRNGSLNTVCVSHETKTRVPGLTASVGFDS